MDEKWNAIDGYLGFYEVSTFGRVRSISRTVRGPFSNRIAHSRILSPSCEESGYPKVHLWRDGKSRVAHVHRLVAKSFLKKEIPRSIDVNHIDGVKTNNSVKNLELCTRTENMKHAVSNGLSRGKIKVNK